MKLAKVTLRNRSGEIRKVNQFDYTADIAKWVRGGYTVVGESQGNATQDAIDTARVESKIERQRRNDPARESRFGDKARQKAARSTKVNIISPSAAKAAAKAEKEVSWDKLPWVKRRAHVKEVTGTSPRNMAQAVALMKEKDCVS